jgi:hypothetical protein
MSQPPKFEKINPHYVPQFWQRNFADHSGHLFGRYLNDADPDFASSHKRAGKARPVNTQKR